MTISEERRAAVAGALREVRAIAEGGPVDRDALARMKQPLIALARRKELFPEAHFPGPAAGEDDSLYLLSEDDDRRFALYVYRPGPTKRTPPHNHTTWAIVIGVDGVEQNTVYRRVDDGSVPGHAEVVPVEEIAVGPGQAVAYLPDDIHSIRIPGDRPILHLHMYGRSLLDLPKRVAFDPPSKTVKVAMTKPNVRRPLD